MPEQLLREYSTQEDLRQAADHCSQRPHLYHISHSVKYAVEKRFPESPVRLFSNRGKPKYWLAEKDNHFVRKFILIGVEADVSFDRRELASLLDEFFDATQLLKKRKRFMVIAEGDVTDFVSSLYDVTSVGQFRGYCRQKDPTMTTNEYFGEMFYMTDQQMKDVKERSIVPPAGYEITELRPDDIKVVVSTWTHSNEGDAEMSIAKMRNLPSICVRHEGAPAAFCLSDHTGNLNHLFTLREHRRKGLGTVVELALSQKLIEIGTVPYKFVEGPNRQIIAWSDSVGYWTPLMRDGRIAYFAYQDVEFSNWQN